MFVCAQLSAKNPRAQILRRWRKFYFWSFKFVYTFLFLRIMDGRLAVFIWYFEFGPSLYAQFGDDEIVFGSDQRMLGRIQIEIFIIS